MNKRVLLEEILSHIDLIDLNISSIDNRLKSLEKQLKDQPKTKTSSKRSAAGKAKE